MVYKRCGFSFYCRLVILLLYDHKAVTDQQTEFLFYKMSEWLGIGIELYVPYKDDSISTQVDIWRDWFLLLQKTNPVFMNTDFFTKTVCSNSTFK